MQRSATMEDFWEKMNKMSHVVVPCLKERTQLIHAIRFQHHNKVTSYFGELLVNMLEYRFHKLRDFFTFDVILQDFFVMDKG
mmetsp:Transcript_26654/g.36793  ORF Transcript_26654/g.36793 Transcript_26654/m.36793 type:complete len:82 (-) Transcript_26654:128-373(-)